MCLELLELIFVQLAYIDLVLGYLVGNVRRHTLSSRDDEYLGGVVHNQTGTGPLVSVSNGMMTFDITIDATDSSPFIISGTVKVTNMPACAAVDEPFSTSLTHGCTAAFTSAQ